MSGKIITRMRERKAQIDGRRATIGQVHEQTAAGQKAAQMASVEWSRVLQTMDANRVALIGLSGSLPSSLSAALLQKPAPRRRWWQFWRQT